MNLPRLNEIDSGPLCTGKTYEEVKRVMPEEYAARKADKLGYRYPAGGESYKDVIERVSPIIIELERLKCPVLMVAHQAILRCIYAYFHGSSPQEVSHFAPLLLASSTSGLPLVRALVFLALIK